MPIHFDAGRMAEVQEAHNLWWEGKLNRPLVYAVISDAHPKGCTTAAPMLSQSTCTDLTWSPEEIISAMDDQLSQCEFLGDGYPKANFDAFGPGVLAAFCGAKLDNSSGRVWFFPKEELEIADIHVKYDPDNIWAQRIKAIYRAGMERWEGNVIMGMPDLGGVLDVAATLRGSENLLMDLYDEPEEVVRLANEIQTAWYEAYNDFAAVLAPQKGFTDWSGIFSTAPSYIIQCDFCYMIGNPMFREFVKDTLQKDTQILTHTIYHLDGVGELNHLDDVLSLEKLNAVQWVYGGGKPSAPHWMDVYRKIQDAGKQMMIVGSSEDYMTVLSQLHNTPYFNVGGSVKDTSLIEAAVNAR